ncbi:MAG: EAL domain-containing protein [Sulfurimonas sp.]|jgi:PAS domain S-box-containing protein/diguanylate cyclase (GGDEF)-like protein
MDELQTSCLSLEGDEEVTLTPLEYNKILDIQQNIYELLTVGNNEEEVLAKLCQMAESLLPNSVASVMILDSFTGLMNVISAPSIPQIGHDALQGLTPGLGGGSCGNAVFQNEPQYVQDTKTDKRWTDIRQIAYDFNLCSCWSMPIRNVHKQAIGSFALSSFEHRSPSGFHKRLLEVCAFIVNVVLKRSEYEKELKESQKKLVIFRTGMKNSSEGVIITDAENNIVEVNSAFEIIFGYKTDEVIGKNPSILSSGKYNKEFYEIMWSAILSNKHWSGEIWNKRLDGEFFLQWMSISAISDDEGQIINYLAIFTDLSELRANQQKLIHLASYDQLTSLPNRQKMVLDIDTLHPYGCIVFNIDKFREINDLFGVAVGDAILVQVAEWFQAFGLNVYRIGGDEFATLLYEAVEWEALERKLTQWLEELAKTSFRISDELISIRMNIGVTLGREKLLTQADIALHNAKEAKSAYALYEKNENIEELYRTNIAMATTVHKALSDGRVICHYQPIVDFTSGKIVKYEALVRLIDEDGSIIPPLVFLPIAKKTKLYSQITRAVIHHACYCFEHRDEEFSINLSIDDIEDPVTVQEIITTLLKTHTASKVVFEILESEGIENYNSVVNFITQVKALGAKIAIDDFGSGYSNFEHILKLHVDYIKIDGSLVRGVMTNERHSIIIETIVDFASKIGAKTIAEFVSDETIFNSLKALGVNYSQGYYTGKPEVLV